jgi:hypothetical protein
MPGQQGDGPHTGPYPAPHSYMYSETLGRWHTIDLFVGLAYLANREAAAYPAADIAAQGMALGKGLASSERLRLMVRTGPCVVQRRGGAGARKGGGD